MKLLVSDDAIFTIVTEEDKKAVLEFLAKDEWSEPYIMECSVKDIPDTPLFFSLYRENFEVEVSSGAKLCVPPLDASDDELSETARDIGLLLIFPKNGELVGKPTRYTAFSSICARAGISGSTITNSDEKPLLSILPLVEKAQWLSRGFSLHKATCKILYRDGKVSSMLSADYEIMPANEVVPRFENRVRKEHPNMTFASGMLSHEYLYLDYMLNNTDMEESLLAMLEEYNVHASSIKAGVRFSTSDIGNSCVTAAPFYDIDGVRVRLGAPIALSHDHGHKCEHFIKLLDGLAMVFKESEDRIEELGNMEIKHPHGCFMHILDKNRTLKTGSESIADGLDAEFPSGCTAIDIYLALNRIIEERNNKKPLSPTQLINLSETIAKLLLIDYKEYDRIWTEED